MKKITVFTPTFNRSRTLVRTYQSLCRQTSDDFEWLVIDDGSTDNTKNIVEDWIKESVIPIRYIYQENKGVYEARKTAYNNIETELCTCIDSDDWMPDDAVEKILQLWKEKGSDKYAGIIGLDAYEDGTIIGKVPEGLTETTMRDYYEVYGGVGDRKQVYRTDIIKKYPDPPVFEGERFCFDAYKFYLIDKDYKLLVSNDVYAIVEIGVGGLSDMVWKLRWNNPKGIAYAERLSMRQTKSKKLAFKYCMHYIACSIRSKNIYFISESPKKTLTILTLPAGFALFIYYWYKARLFYKGKFA